MSIEICSAVNPRTGWQCGLGAGHKGEYDSEAGRHLTIIDGERYDWYLTYDWSPAIEQDGPDFTPRMNVEITYPVGVTDEDMHECRGMNVVISSSYMTPDARVLALLRLAESMLGEGIRDAFRERALTDATPIDDEILEGLVALNVRTASMAMLATSSMDTPEAFGMTISDEPANEGEPHV